MVRSESNAAQVEAAVRRYAQALPRVLARATELWTIETKDAIKAAAPSRTGEAGLRGAIHGESSEGTDGPDASLTADKSYAAPVEFGSRAHEILPRNKMVLRFPSAYGGWQFADSVQHPGTSAQPFFFNTIEDQLPELGTICNQSLDELARQSGLDGLGR